GRVRYAPVIGSGPVPADGKVSAGRPLVEDPDAWQHSADQPGEGQPAEGKPVGHQAVGSASPGSHSSAAHSSGSGLTVSGHEVGEFVAGSAHMVQMLAGEFPLGTVPEQGLGEVV